MKKTSIANIHDGLAKSSLLSLTSDMRTILRL